MKIIRMKLEGGTKFPKQYRYNETSGQVEVTYDDGATWTPDPTADPRTSTALIQVKGAGSECDAATNITAFLQTNIENVLGAMADFGTAGGIVGALTSLLLTAFFALGPFGIIVTLFFALSAYLAELGSVAIQTAFINGEWDIVKCNIYCHVPAEGKFTQDSLDLIQTKMTETLNPTAAGIVIAFMELMGPVGMTNAAHTGAGGSDCGDCACDNAWCYEFDFTSWDGGFTRLTAPNVNGIYTVGEGWKAQYNSTGSITQLAITKAFNAQVTKLELTYNVTRGQATETTPVALRTYSGATIVQKQPVTNGDGQLLTYTGNISLTGIQILLVPGNLSGNGSNPGGTGIAVKLRIEGTGDNPFGEENCV